MSGQAKGVMGRRPEPWERAEIVERLRAWSVPAPTTAMS